MKRYGTSDYPHEMDEEPGGLYILHADHAAFVERVREIAEGMEHDPGCDSLIEEWIDAPGHIGFVFMYKCNCRRGKLLEVCNG